MYLAHNPYECVHGFNFWKRPHDQRSGSCYSDSNVSSSVATSGMMKSRHETTSSFGVVASMDLCVANPFSFDNSFQQASNDGVSPLVMNSFPEM